MREIAILSVVVSALAMARPAGADEPFDYRVQYTHQGQFGVQGAGGFGFRFIAPYNEEYCGQVDQDNPSDPKAVCSARSPFALDLGLSYGVARSLELLFETRIGLERDFGASPSDDDGPRQLAFAPGIKIYIRDAGLTKFFSSLQFAIDVTDFAQASKTDYGVRNTNGLQFDFHRTFGVYFYFGETLAFARWFRFEMDAGIGLQFRVP